MKNSGSVAKGMITSYRALGGGWDPDGVGAADDAKQAAQGQA